MNAHSRAMFSFKAAHSNYLRLADVLSRRSDVRADGELRADVRADARRAGDWVPTIV